MKKTIWRIGCAAAALVLLCGCGAPALPQDAPPADSYALLQSVALTDPAAAYFADAGFTADGFYLGTTGWDEAAQATCEQLIFFDTAGMARRTLSLGISPAAGERDDVFVACHVAGDGDIYAVQQQAVGGGWQPTTYARFSPAGEAVLQTPLAGVPAGLGTVQAMAVDADQNLWALFSAGDADRRLAFFDANGRFGGTMPQLDGAPYALISGMNGQVYAAVQGADGKRVMTALDAAGGAARSYTGLCGSGTGIWCAETDTTFLYADTDAVWRYDAAAGGAEKLFDWLEKDTLPQYIAALCADGTTGFWVLYGETGGMQLRLDHFVLQSTLPDADDQPAEPQQITLAVQWAGNQSLRQTVANFNRTHPEYKVVLYNYLEEAGDDMAAALQRAQMELTATGGAFDLICLINLDVRGLARAGVFEDLYPYLDREGGLGRDAIFEAVLAAHTLGDELVTLPASFSLSCLAGKQSLLGDRTNWTLREMVDLAAQHPAARLFVTGQRQNVMDQTLGYGVGMFFVPQEGGAVFDAALCADYLSLMDRTPDMVRDISTAAALQSEQALLTHITLDNFYDVQYAQALFGGDVAYIGYPTYDAANGSAMAENLFVGDFAICANAAHKEGAWAFLEYYLTEGDIDIGFPTLKSRFDAAAASLLYDQWLRDETGALLLDDEGAPQLASTHAISESEPGTDNYWYFEYGPTTEADVAMIRALLQRGAHTTLGWRKDALYGIFLEEAAAYFAGVRPLEETVAILADRMGTYWAEQYG